ncbi:uncharacterized protein LOC141629462 [Silene latifolia]|uniref:uncharacterized protein LOC141629462 n=1 Tax=Silene latifolia TaxID=37657 RepID=UPI003D780C98
MIGKFVWWLAEKSDHLWIRWVNHIYIKGKHLMDYTPCNTSWTWRKICQVKELLKPGFTNGVWTGSPGPYSVSTGYNWMKGVHLKVPWYPLIWSRLIIPKHSFIGWLTVQGRLYTKDRMLSFGMVTNGLYEFCLDKQETHEHILYQCEYSMRCWQLLQQWLGMTFPVHNLITWCIRWRCKSLLKKQVVMASIMTLIYHLWYAWNVCRVEAKIEAPWSLVKRIKEEICVRCRSKPWAFDLQQATVQV